MCPAWYYLTGIVALAGALTLLKQFEVRAKVAREAPFDRNVEKPLVFLKIQLARAGRFFKICEVVQSVFSYVLLKSDVEIVEKPMGL